LTQLWETEKGNARWIGAVQEKICVVKIGDRVQGGGQEEENKGRNDASERTKPEKGEQVLKEFG